VDTKWRKDQPIYRQGDSAKQAWYIKTGTVVLRRHGGGNGTNGGNAAGAVRALRFPGSLIGLEVLVDDDYTDTAIAGSDTVLCVVDHDNFDTWLGPKEDPARTALELMLRTEATELRPRRHHEGSALQRTAAWLRDETPRLQSIALQRRELAELLSMRAETLSRVLAKLAKSGAITVTRSHVRITDGDALRAAAAG
jgi:CRP-like cAMP-binding protein